MPFENGEMQARAEQLRFELRARKLDALLIDDCEATAYYFNYESSVSFYRAGVIPVEGEAFFVARTLDVAPLRDSTWIKDIVSFPDWESPATIIAREIRQRGLDRKRIGIDLTSHALTAQTFEALKRELPHVEFVDVDGLPWKMRKVKSKAEIQKLRKCAEITDAVLQEILEATKPGFTIREAYRMPLKALFGLEASLRTSLSSRSLKVGILCTAIVRRHLSSWAMCSISSSFRVLRATAHA